LSRRRLKDATRASGLPFPVPIRSAMFSSFARPRWRELLTIGGNGNVT
jgi:hypothetical protein